MADKIRIFILLILIIPFFCFSAVNYIERTMYGEWIFRYEIDSKTVPPEYENGSNTQKIISVKGTVYLMENTVCLDMLPSSCGYPLSEGDYTDELRDYCVPFFYGYGAAEYGRLKKTAEEIVGDAALLHEAVYKIIRYIRANVSYSSNAPTEPLKVLARGRTYCVGYANLAVILLRSAGIPARSRTCYMPPGKNWGSSHGGWHEYIEVFYPGAGWLSCDPQDSVFFVDPYHIVMERNASYRRQVGEEKRYTTLEYVTPEGFRKTRTYDLKKRLVEGEDGLYIFRGTVLLDEGERLSSIEVNDYPSCFKMGNTYYRDYSYDIIIDGNTFLFGFSKTLFPDDIGVSVNGCHMSIGTDTAEGNMITAEINLKKTTDDGLPNPHILTFEFRHPLTSVPVSYGNIFRSDGGGSGFFGRTDRNGTLSRYFKDENEKNAVFSSSIFMEKSWYLSSINPSGRLYFTFGNTGESPYVSRTFSSDADYYRDAFERDGCAVLGSVSFPGTPPGGMLYAFVSGRPGETAEPVLLPLSGKNRRKGDFYYFYNKEKGVTTIILAEEGRLVLYDGKHLVVLSSENGANHLRVEPSECNLILSAQSSRTDSEIMITTGGSGTSGETLVFPLESAGGTIFCFLSSGEYYIGLNDVIMRKIIMDGNVVRITLDEHGLPNYDVLREYYSGRHA
ncbi:MAG: transglutaminase domain-containing protein [Spirochaetales bacterium]|nr:transglutaminase domain-containing protein [Spirochaetales bacterium]